MNVLMLDDHVMFLQGLKNLLSVMAPELSVDTCRDLTHAIELVQLSSYDLVLLDWRLVECNGDESIRRLRDAGCAARIVVLSGENSTELIRSTIEMGAAGFVPKTYSSEMMIKALDHVLAGRIYLPAEALLDSPARHAPAESVRSDPRMAGLTARQIEVYLAAARGLPNKLIARQLDIAESTVKAHLSAVYAALGVHNRTEAALQASRDGLRLC